MSPDVPIADTIGGRRLSPVRAPVGQVHDAPSPAGAESMTPQIGLPGFDADADALPCAPEIVRGELGQSLGYNLFFALFPSGDDAMRVAAFAADRRTQFDLRGACLDARRLHVTLHVVAHAEPVIRRQVVDAASVAAASVVCARMPIVFDHVQSFHNDGHRQNNAFVLRCDAASDAAIARLRQSLAMALRRTGVRSTPSPTPHMTLLYDRRLVPAQAIEPICWTATRWALVLSHVGVGRHDWLGRWDLS